ncbi:MAG: hypothetical protein ATN36_03050 [Epulopiscium sp. Nele67-Bin005]|nr:MAG: hypothetical protein ATN36_03050 [Epulopiscium sp. Nele67-Bin005]
MGKNIKIKGTDSDWYDNVTFCLKDNCTQHVPQNLTQYADELIERHMKLKGYSEGVASKYATYEKSDGAKKQSRLYDKIDLFCKCSLLILSAVLIMFVTY